MLFIDWMRRFSDICSFLDEIENIKSCFFLLEIADLVYLAIFFVFDFSFFHESSSSYCKSSTNSKIMGSSWRYRSLIFCPSIGFLALVEN